MTPEERATQAKRLLDDPLLKEMLETVERDCLEHLLRVDAAQEGADRARSVLIDRINTIRELRSLLQTAVTVAQLSARPRLSPA